MYKDLIFQGSACICREELLSRITTITSGKITVRSSNLNNVATESLNNLFESYGIHFSSTEIGNCNIKFRDVTYKHMLSLAIFMAARTEIEALINKKGINDYLYEYIIKNYTSLFTRDVPEYRFRNALMTSFGLYLLRQGFDLHIPYTDGISAFLSRGSDFNNYRKEFKDFINLYSIDSILLENVGVKSGDSYITLGSFDSELFNVRLNSLVEEWNV